MDSVYEEAYSVAQKMILRKITTPPIIVDRGVQIIGQRQRFILDSYAKQPLSPKNRVGRIDKWDNKNVFWDKNIRDYIKNALNYAYPKAYASAKFTKDYLLDTSVPAGKIPLSPSSAFNVQPYDFTDPGGRSQKELLELNAEYFSNKGRFKKINVGFVQPRRNILGSILGRTKNILGLKGGALFYDRTPDLKQVFNELQRFIQIPYEVFNGELNTSPKKLANKKVARKMIFFCEPR
jgi:hypothetical protein